MLAEVFIEKEVFETEETTAVTANTSPVLLTDKTTFGVVEKDAEKL
tara:strand:- start:19 stop:156 length:138 start_codon:yes stop_codon:yes gene_type:complete